MLADVDSPPRYLHTQRTKNIPALHAVCPASQTRDKSQLASILLAMLVQMCHVRKAADHIGGRSRTHQPQWWTEEASMLGGVSEVPAGVTKASFHGTMARSIPTQAKVSAVWEQTH